MPEPNATPAPLEAALHSLREIIALRTGPERGNLSPEHIYEQQSMEHHAILTVSGMRLVLAEVESTRAKLAEAEAQRDACIESYREQNAELAEACEARNTAESRVAALTEAGSAMLDALEDADANLTKPDFEKCTDLHVVRMFGEPDDYDCGGVNCAQCIEQESWDKVAAAIKLGRAALSPSQDAKDGA